MMIADIRIAQMRTMGASGFGLVIFASSVHVLPTFEIHEQDGTPRPAIERRALHVTGDI